MWRHRGLLVAVGWCGLWAAGSMVGCNSDAGSKGSGSGRPQGEFVCDTTPEDCIEIFRGTYSGNYDGSENGTFSVYIAADGTVEGTVTDSSGNTFAVSGSVDETGVVEFGSEETGTFTGVIEFGGDVTGEWSGGPGSGGFDGTFVSIDPVTTTSGTGGATSTSSETTTTGSGGSATMTYCDRTDAKAVECGVDTTGCTEPSDDVERCQAECLLTLSCAELEEGFPLLDCLAACSSDGERDYCLEYENKLVECNKSDTVLLLDICTTPATPTNACVWGCVLAASCEDFMAEQALIDTCTTDCTAL